MRDTGEKSAVEAFWDLARFHANLNSAPTYFGPTTLEVVPPPAWAFGDSAEEADELLQLVLDGTKTATASALWDYEAEGEALPEVGSLSILLDGRGHPRALINTTDVEVVPFDEVERGARPSRGRGRPVPRPLAGRPRAVLQPGLQPRVRAGHAGGAGAVRGRLPGGVDSPRS